jgi:hypothetical protein
VVIAGLGCVLIAVGLGEPPARSPLPASQIGGELRVPASEATWVGFNPPAGAGQLLWAGDASGGAVTYLKFDVPPLVDGQVARLQLTSAGQPLPALVELVTVPDTTWDDATLTWQTAPILGRVVQSVRPEGGESVVFDLTDAIAGPGVLAFAVTVPPDRGYAVFVGADGSPAQPMLRLPRGHDPSPSVGPSPGVAPSPSVGPSPGVAPSPTATPSPSAVPTATPSPGAPSPSTGPAEAAPGPTIPPASWPPTPDPILPSGSGSPTAPPGPSVSPGMTASPSASHPTTPPPSRPACALGERLLPECGVLWGAAPAAHTGQPRTAALEAFEAVTGRQQDIYHAYHRGEALFPTAEEVAIAAGGRLLFLNWKPQDWSWAQIAAGAADSYLDRLAHHINSRFTEPFFFTIHHEPENDVRAWSGSGFEAVDYAAMYRRVVKRLRSNGVDNLVTVIAYMAYVPWNTRPWFPELYPGDDVVDWIAWDTYAYSDPGYGYGDFAEMMNRRSARFPEWPGFYTWATQQFPDKPFMLAEWGVWLSRDNPDHMARFYESVARQTPLFPRVKAMVYFDTPGDQRARDSRPTATEAGLAAYRRLGTYPYFQVRLATDDSYGDDGLGYGYRPGYGADGDDHDTGTAATATATTDPVRSPRR